MVWVRSKCSVLSIIVGLVEAVALLLLPIFLGVTFYGVTVIFAGLALVIRLMYLAVGRPLERKNNGAAVTSDPGWDTEPIPRVSVEEVEEFERPGY
ncbi:hypothetical protein Ae505Ps2_6265c [Pseudonocardia sp. Ae505_Ps2]|nr:hypothetical protein Ae505Ps2_6265c [Pseudonocardia sp. Ae505_Ps2]